MRRRWYVLLIVFLKDVRTQGISNGARIAFYLKMLALVW